MNKEVYTSQLGAGSIKGDATEFEGCTRPCCFLCRKGNAKLLEG